GVERKNGRTYDGKRTVKFADRAGFGAPLERRRVPLRGLDDIVVYERHRRGAEHVKAPGDEPAIVAVRDFGPSVRRELLRVRGPERARSDPDTRLEQERMIHGGIMRRAAVRAHPPKMRRGRHSFSGVASPC